MSRLSYKKAKEQGLIKEAELDRLATLALYFADQIKPTGPQYEEIVKDYGGVAGSYRNAIANLTKKLKEAGCYIEGSAAPDGTEGVIVSTPKKATATKAATPRKRKNEVTEGEGEGEGEATNGAKTPKRSRTSKKVNGAAKESEKESSEEEVKDEEVKDEDA